MEKIGVPAVVVVTEPFISSAKAMAVSHGIPEFPFVTIPHPIAATEKHIIQEWADPIVDQVISILVEE